MNNALFVVLLNVIGHPDLRRKYTCIIGLGHIVNKSNAIIFSEMLVIARDFQSMDFATFIIVNRKDFLSIYGFKILSR